MTANWKVVRTTLMWLLVAVMTMAIVIASPYVVKSDAAGIKTVTSNKGLDIKKVDGQWYTFQGKNRVNYTGIAKNSNGWYRVLNGKVDFTANEIYKNDNGWYKTTNGKVNFKETGVFKNERGWWRVVNSKVDFGANSIYKNDKGWWKTTNGRVTFQENGVFKNEKGWWKVVNSRVDFSFTGVADNANGVWYLEGGKVRFDKNGSYTDKATGENYYIINGKAIGTAEMKDIQAYILQVKNNVEKEAEIHYSRPLLIEDVFDDSEFYLKKDVVTVAVDEMDINWKTQALLASADILGDWDAKEYNGFSEKLYLQTMKEDLAFTQEEVDYAHDIVKKEANKDGGYWKNQCRAAAQIAMDAAKEDKVTLTKQDLTDILTELLFTENQVKNVVNEFFPGK